MHRLPDALKTGIAIDVPQPEIELVHAAGYDGANGDRPAIDVNLLHAPGDGTLPYDAPTAPVDAAGPRLGNRYASLRTVVAGRVP